MRLVIIVEGGVVQGVYAGNSQDEPPPIDCLIVDYDNLEAGGKTRTEATHIGMRATDRLHAIPTSEQL